MKNQLVVKSYVLCECFLSLTQSMIAHSHFFITDLCITLTNPWLIVNDCPNHKPIVQITNPWLICDCPQISHQPSLQRPKASNRGGPWRATAPRPLTRFEPHPRQATTTTGPRQFESHANLKPTSRSWERGEAFTVRGREERAWEKERWREKGRVWEEERVWLKNELFLYNPMNSEVAYMQPHCSWDVKIFWFA